MGSDFWRDSFGPMLGGTHKVAFGDLVGIEKQPATKTIAAVVLEPIQAEGGIVLPPADYLVGVQRLCRTYGTCAGVMLSRSRKGLPINDGGSRERMEEL